MIHLLQTWLQKIYRIDSPLASLENYLLSRDELKDCLGEESDWLDAEELVTFSQTNGECHLGLYLAPSIYHRDQRQFSTHQIMTQIEGISHCLLLSCRAQAEQPTTQLEMELQAEIDKFLFFRLALPGSQSCRAYYHLKRPANLKTLSYDQKNLYQQAHQLARRYCHFLETRYFAFHSVDPLLEELRSFYRLSHWQKLRVLAA